MKRYAIRYGLGGSFGGIQDEITAYCKDEKEAYNYAYDSALENYQSYEGMGGLLSYYECLEHCNGDEEDAEAMYYEEVDSWIVVEIEEVGEDYDGRDC